MSEALQTIGGIAAVAAAAVAILSGDRRLRAVAMAAALAFALSVVAGQAWDGQLAAVRESPLKLVALAAAALLGIGALAVLGGRHPQLLPLGLLAMLPFRIPVEAGGESSNLLLPLYAVIAAGILLEFRRTAGAAGEDLPEGTRCGPARWLSLALAAAIGLYALQSAYSSDVERATQNIAFFFVPFALMFALLRDAEWTPRVLRTALLLVLAEGVGFAAIGIAQHLSHHIFWNHKAMESNEFDLNFRVNSLFYDPNIYGRYLALTLVVGTTALLWVQDAKRFLAGALALGVIFAGLALAFSQTSFVALLAGLVVLTALRWSLRWTVVAGAVLALAATVVVVFFSSGTIEIGGGSGNALDQTTSGRSRLASGGLKLARERPLAGFGSGSFAAEFEKRNPLTQREAAVSHTEPVTIAAEQGAVGVAAYLALLAAALALLLSGLRSIAPGLSGLPVGNAPSPGSPAGKAEEPAVDVARIAATAAFAGLFAHTIGYAGFLTDPLTWALLAVAIGITPSLQLGSHPLPPTPIAGDRLRTGGAWRRNR
ncbi:MAG: O-antigen ligase family protein [Solirubrobacterales bacterium]